MPPTPEEEFAALRKQMEEAISTVNHSMPADEMKILKDAADRDKRRWRLSLALLLVGGPFLFGMTLLLTYRGYDTANDQRSQIRNGIACLLAETDAHRIDNRGTHEQLAQGHNLTIPPAPAPILRPDQVEAFKQRCDEFVKAAISLGLDPGSTAQR